MSIGELLVGLGTLALAVATVALVVEARMSRRDASDGVRRRLFRAAASELLDALRSWQSANPAHGGPALDRLRRSEPKLDAMSLMLDSVDLPPDLAVYLVWLRGRIREEWQYWLTVILVAPSDDPSPVAHAPDSGVGYWSRMVDRLEVAAALIASEADHQGFDEIKRFHDAAPWVVTLEGPPDERLHRAANDQALLGAPRFPAAPRFALATPHARDGAGVATGEAQRATLMPPANPAKWS